MPLKKILTILLLLVVVIQSTSQSWILLSFYFKRDSIAKNTCINRFIKNSTCKGSCALMKKLKAVENSEQQSPDLKKSEINLYCEQYKLVVHEISQEENCSASIAILNSEDLPGGFLSAVFRPPNC